jgi:hypothetical protein
MPGGMERVNEAGKREYGNEYAGDRWAFWPSVAFAWTDFPVDGDSVAVLLAKDASLGSLEVSLGGQRSGDAL